MFQHTRLHELPLSTKVLLTSFILTICAAGALGIVAFHHACKDTDGQPKPPFQHLGILLGSAHQLVPERPTPPSYAQLAAGTALYFAAVALAFLGLGAMFVNTSLFEKTKISFLAAAFGFAAACPVFLWLGMSDPNWLYAMLFSGLLLTGCLGVMALVSLYDLWFRRAAS